MPLQELGSLSWQQQVAFTHVALVAGECAHPRFGKRSPLGMVVLTVNAGYE